MSTAEVVIAGVGMTRFTKQAERGHSGLVEEAVPTAMKDAGVTAQDIQAAFFASAERAGPGQRLLRPLGVAGIPIVNVHNACASGPTAVREAYAWIRGGLIDCALAVGVEIVSVRRGPLPIPEGVLQDVGLNLPGWYALKAKRHMHEHGLTREELASVVVKSRGFAVDNPYSHFRKPTTVEDVMGAMMIADPLTLPECCPKVDGAAAAIICSADFAKSRGIDGVKIRASAMTSGQHVYTDDPAPEEATTRAARLLWEEAGIGPEDIDVAECHDAFAIGEILYTEALGICPEGEGGKYAAAGATSLGGQVTTVNPSGGLLSRGHPIAASGIAQLTEVVWHLRGQAGARQVPNARLGLVHTLGASDFALDADACCVYVLER